VSQNQLERPVPYQWLIRLVPGPESHISLRPAWMLDSVE
jgi:hypothetical protein